MHVLYTSVLILTVNNHRLPKFVSWSLNVKGTGVMKWISHLRYQTEASLWQWQERRCMLTTKSGIWQSDVWVCLHVYTYVRMCLWHAYIHATLSCSYQARGPSSKPLKLKHFFFTAWPDHGVPQHPYSLVTFIQHIRKVALDSPAPLVVHCRYVSMGKASCVGMTILLCVYIGVARWGSVLDV